VNRRARFSPRGMGGPTRDAVRTTHVGLSQNAAGLRGANLAESLIAKLRGRNPPAHTLYTGGESFTALIRLIVAPVVAALANPLRSANRRLGDVGRRMQRAFALHRKRAPYSSFERPRSCARSLILARIAWLSARRSDDLLSGKISVVIVTLTPTQNGFLEGPIEYTASMPDQPVAS